MNPFLFQESYQPRYIYVGPNCRCRCCNGAECGTDIDDVSDHTLFLLGKSKSTILAKYKTG